MRSMTPCSVDAVVCDPPYGLRFMGKEFDTLGDGPAQQEWHYVWAVEAERVLKPGGYLMAFGGTRTFHRLVLAVAEAGFVVNTTWAWCYGSGFPKSHNIGKAIDKANGTEHLRKFKAKNPADRPYTHKEGETSTGWQSPPRPDKTYPGSPEAEAWDGWGTALKPAWEPIVIAHKPGSAAPLTGPGFLYCAKANKKERNAGLDTFEVKRPDHRTSTAMGTFEQKGVQPQRNHHPTVKPVNVMRWLIAAATNPGDLVLDPFTGSGTTGIAAILEGRDFHGIEMEPEYAAIADCRCRHWETNAPEQQQESLF